MTNAVIIFCCSCGLLWVFGRVAYWIVYGAYAHVQIMAWFHYYVKRRRRRCWLCEHPRRKPSVRDGVCRHCRQVYLQEIAG